MTLPLAASNPDRVSEAGPPASHKGPPLTIGDMARRYGVSLRALRFYEGRGLLAPRRDGTVRLYGPAECRRLEVILKGKRLGFTLAEIAEMAGRDAASGAVLALGADQVVAQIEHLRRQRHSLDAAIRELQTTHARLVRASA